MKQLRSLFEMACWALLASFVSVGVAWAEPYAIQFKSGVVTPDAGAYEIPQSAYMQTTGTRVHVLLQLEDYLQAGDRERLKADGIELLSYFPDRAYAASIPPTLDVSLLPGLGVRSVTPLWADYKLHPRVTRGEFGPWSEFSSSERIFAVEVHSDVTLDEAVSALKLTGWEPGHRFVAAHSLLVAGDPRNVNELASMDFVAFIDECPPPPEMVNDVARTRLHVNEVQSDPYNLSGASVTILVYDGGMVDSTHPDFGERVTWNEIAAIADHPTHVAGTVGGDGTQSDGTYRGMAPGARIISGQYDVCIPYCLYESPNDFEPDYTQARRQFGVELTTNSIGANISPNGYNCDWMGDYETTSRLLDQMTRDVLGEPLIMFFAAGNERNDAGCGLASYRCMSVPAGAKNIITCGATTSTDATASFSSWGPTDDGRIKPEVSATGVNLTSCAPGPGYGYQDMSGTSMATPATSGTACLILERWHLLFPGAPDPLPETMKAILINSTTDIGAAGPDYQTGFGLVNALKSVQNLNLGGVYEGSLDVGEELNRPFAVAAGTAVLDVSIAWSDVPAAGNVTPTLVNDLDLRLVAPDGTIHLPYTLLPQNPGSPAGRGDDSINVCERASVANPPAGTWTLRVTGTINSGSSQTFGVCANVTLVDTWAAISGQIRDNGNTGIPGEVSISGGAQRQLTDANGNYTLSVPGNTTYTVAARAYGYLPAQTQVVVTNGTVTQNFTLSTAQTGTVHGTVTNQFGTPLLGATLTAFFPNATIPPATTGADGTYELILPGGNSYELRCAAGSDQASTTVTVPENGNVTANFEIEDARYNPTGPDDYGYYAYEANDPGLPAVYDWTEISPNAGGAGTLVPSGTASNDWVVNLTCPFPVRYYGVESTNLRIGADGWVGIGTGANGTAYSNQPIPTAADPNTMIAVMWDDNNPGPAQSNRADGAGDISTYHDAANDRFIVEYHDVAHFSPTTNRTTAQLIIYSQAERPTLTGDNEFELMFQHVDYEDNSSTDADGTIGCENGDGTTGLQIVYAGTYDATVFGLSDSYALRFTTGAVTGHGAIRGRLTMHPAPDYTQVPVVLGPYTITPAADGTYFFTGVVARSYTMTVSYPDYELGSNSNVVVNADDTTTVDFELWRMDPARNLVGEYDWAVPEIRLNWDPALSLADGAANGRGRGALDGFLGYEIWLGGRGLQGTTQDTFFVYPVTQSRAYNFWILARYDGGDADTSNHYRVTVDLAAADVASLIPDRFYLAQNYPNPFNPSTTIEYGLPRSVDVRIEVFNVLGMQVATLLDGLQPAGVHQVEFNGAATGTGIYYCRIQAGEFSGIQKMLLMK
ncbi:S8 family serine peptidase [candidate division KSB1 bacterium]|nr:S8 family serine peptidase [candidate division KSB1 bacterium]